MNKPLEYKGLQFDLLSHAHDAKASLAEQKAEFAVGTSEDMTSLKMRKQDQEDRT